MVSLKEFDEVGSKRVIIKTKVLPRKSLLIFPTQTHEDGVAHFFYLAAFGRL